MDSLEREFISGGLMIRGSLSDDFGYLDYGSEDDNFMSMVSSCTSLFHANREQSRFGGSPGHDTLLVITPNGMDFDSSLMCVDDHDFHTVLRAFRTKIHIFKRMSSIHKIFIKQVKILKSGI
jgi:hypothetical protein